MKSQLEYWSQKDFLAYLLIYCANADFQVTKEEKKFILKKVGKQEYKDILQVYKQHSDFDKSETVRKLGEKFCNDPLNKCDVRTEIIKLFFADDDYNILEKNFFVVIKKILNLNA